VAIARLNETGVSRTHVRLQPSSDQLIQIENHSGKNPVFLSTGDSIAAGEKRELFVPFVLSIGDKAVRTEWVEEEEESGYQSLIAPTVLPDTIDRLSSENFTPAIHLLPDADRESIVRWLQTVIGVLQSAAGSNDFFQRAAQGMIDIVGLDSGGVLLCKGGLWEMAALKRRHESDGEQPVWKPSHQILNMMRSEKRTFWQSPSQSGVSTASLAGVQAVVTAPILDGHGEVIGALYGDRLHDLSRGMLPQITKLDAMLAETLACGVAAGLARLEQERAAMAAQIQFEQFFTPELSRQLALEPDLLKGRDAEVSLLFCDIRGFSRVSERLGPAGTVEWIGDVMSAMSDCVLDRKGVLVDYIGDELIAMWGAPSRQEDHAELACAAAIDIMRVLPEMSKRWQEKLGCSFGLGIGINTGIARVGNIGTNRKFKYGPLGNTVNLASRVQGATKYLKTDLLITGGTRAKLPASVAVRQICKVRVVNISEPVELYEVATDENPSWRALCQLYEEGLKQFEQREFRQAAKILSNLLAAFPNDGPALLLLSRAVHQLLNETAEFQSAWELPGK
jgi:adenylate cyclase